MGADQKVDLPGGQPRQCFAPLFGLRAACEQGDGNARAFKKPQKGPVMLLRQHLGGRHQRALQPGFRRAPDQRRRHGGLAAADVPLQEPAHGFALCHIRKAFAYGAFLRPGEGKGEAREEFRRMAAVHGPHARRVQRFVAFQKP